MAAAIVSNFANDLLKTLESPEISMNRVNSTDDVTGGIKSIKELEEELNKLADKVKGIRDVIADAEKKQSSSLTVRGWLKKLGDVLLEADDIMDVIRYQKNVLCPNNDEDDKLIKKVRRLFSSDYPIALSSSVKNVAKIREKLDDLSASRPQIGFNVDRNVANKTGFHEPRGLVGMVAEKQNIIKMLEVAFHHPATNPANVSASSNISSSSSPQRNTGFGTSTANTSSSSPPVTNNMSNISSSSLSKPGTCTTVDNASTSSQLFAKPGNISSSFPQLATHAVSISIPSSSSSSQDVTNTADVSSFTLRNSNTISTNNTLSSPQVVTHMENISSTSLLKSSTGTSATMVNISSSSQPVTNSASISSSFPHVTNSASIPILPSSSSQLVSNTVNTSTFTFPNATSTTMGKNSPSSSQLAANKANIPSSSSAQPGTRTIMRNASFSPQPVTNTANISSSHPGMAMSKISAIALVGLPGSGKTTLAQSVCSDNSVKRHFNRRLWACVSNLWSFEELVTRIVEAATAGKGYSGSSSHQPSDRLSEEIRQKKYLLVLDDMCTSDLRIWDSLRALLDKGAPGSKILITSRYQNVGTAVATSDKIYRLGALSDDDSWLLFQRIAFRTDDTSPVAVTEEQEQIGRDIVCKCENSPLILRQAANLVSQKNNWQQLRDEKLDIMDMFTHHKNGQLLNVLRPSYNQLNAHLKHCFAYCSLFPRDYEFSKQALIQLWMAQGFLQRDHNSGSLEDSGEKQFQDLLRMSFFQAVKLDALGDIVSCRMYKMFHHLAQNVAGAGCLMASGNTKYDDRTLHVSIEFNGSFPVGLFAARKLRTLLCRKGPQCRVNLNRSMCHMIIAKFKRLRTLDLHDCGIDTLPDNVGDLIHLRQLDLSKNDRLEVLPESITKLGNLQVLKLNFCQRLKRLPQSIGRLNMLRCLEIEECDSLTHMPLGLENLVSLQSLSRFVVCLPSETNKGSGGIRVLKGLNNLRGRLKIELSGQWTELVQNAPSANLRDKLHLTDLKIEWSVGLLDETRSCHYYEAFLEGLHPPSGLKVLCIEGYKGRDFPSWARMGTLARCLPHLVMVSIEGCKECKHLPPFGQLDSLKYLTLRNMEGVQYMVDEIYDPEVSPTQVSLFKNLKKLTLHSFYSLKGWWREVRVTEKNGLPSFPLLSKLKIWNCPKLTSMPLFNKVEEVDFLDVGQKLLETTSMKVEPSTSPSSSVHETLAEFSYDRSSGAFSYGLLQNLKELKSLHIKACPRMRSFPTVWDKGIQNLVIDNCDALTSIAEGLQDLKSLEVLQISHCNSLNIRDNANSFPWDSLKKLRFLIFRGISIPEGLNNINTINTLEILHIAKCSDLTSLPNWIHQMSSLKHLRIEACPNLTKLPHASSCLSRLDKLEIMESPELMERCREGGADRSKINPKAQVLLHKSWRYGLTNDAERSSEAMQSQFAVNDTTLTLARKGTSNSWEELTFKSKIKAVK